ncbi:MAG: hypothetical protein PHU51_03300 [Candidatus Nanoarchaeia archaeon]|nr:hypothetical protein [Candidatus Nanoarchaeia archaeon]
MQKLIHTGFHTGTYEHSNFQEIMNQMNAEKICSYSQHNQLDISVWVLNDVVIDYKHLHNLNPPVNIRIHGKPEKMKSVEKLLNEYL